MFQLSSISNQKDSPEATASHFVRSTKPAFFKPFIQPKLSVNQPDDVFEQEADQDLEKHYQFSRE